MHCNKEAACQTKTPTQPQSINTILKKKKEAETPEMYAQGKISQRHNEDLSSVSQGGRPQEKPNLLTP